MPSTILFVLPLIFIWFYFFVKSIIDSIVLSLILPNEFKELERWQFICASFWYGVTVMSMKNLNVLYVFSLPLEKQMEYADPITRKYGIQLVTTQLHDEFVKLSSLNAAAVGNTAWISQFAKDTHKIEIALTRLRQLDFIPNLTSVNFKTGKIREDRSVIVLSQQTKNEQRKTSI